MAKNIIPNKILWLASYPKSGNTWFRAFLTALLNEGEVEINDMDTDGILSARGVFDAISDIDSRYLYDEEVKILLPEVYRAKAAALNQLSIVKVHDAFVYNEEGQSIMPEDVTHAAIYIIRNPLDVVASFANHNNSTIDEAIALMNNPQGKLAAQKGNHNINNQFPQLMYDWSGHVQSWIDGPAFPVYFVRYEDMLAAPLQTFSEVIKKVGWQYSDDTIQAAIDATQFSKLKKQESEKGFQEKNAASKQFFRQGKAGNWKNELTETQANAIIKKHKGVMREFGYL